MNYEDYGDHQWSFQQLYHCVSFSSMNKVHLQNGNKVIMPQSALDRLTSLDIFYPMLFELHKPLAEKVSHCGVLEFTAEEGFIYLPDWMMQNLLLQEEEIVQVRYTTLPKGTFVKLQPHTRDFLDISNPKEMLEVALRSFTCLTTNDTITVPYEGNKYQVDIVETEPASAICIIDTDCEVDFAPPLDYLEPRGAAEPTAYSNGSAQVEKDPSEVKLSFNPFTGAARRVDGKPFEPSVSAASSASQGPRQMAYDEIGSAARSNSSSQPSQPSRGLVFGSNTGREPNGMEADRVPARMQPLQKVPKFKAFTGKRYSLIS